MKYLTIPNKVLTGILIALVFCSAGFADARFDVSIHGDGFGFAIGNYDYLPYAATPPPQVSFEVVLQEYGTWVSVQSGRAWRPYVEPSWRPYVQGHWVVTTYGPTWIGYEPWAWIGYHYGYWALTPEYGWVWFPGYEWSPSRVVWSTGPDMIGWMPTPPPGFNYAAHYGPRYDSVRFNLWVFVDSGNFGHDNYASYCYRQDRVRQVFDRQLVQVRRTPLRREEIERVVRRQVPVMKVQTHEITADHRKIRMVTVEGERERMERNGKTVVQNVIVPGFTRYNRSLPEKDRMAADHEKARNESHRMEYPPGRDITPERADPKHGAPEVDRSGDHGKDHGKAANDKGKKEAKGKKPNKKNKDDGPDRR